MAHGSADDVDGHVAGLGDACPTVAGDIEDEGRLEVRREGIVFRTWLNYINLVRKSGVNAW